MTKERLRGQPTVFSTMLRKRMQEGAFILLVAWAIFLLLALATYSRHDPGWSFSTDSSKLVNKAGFAGAWLADLCYCLFGYVAYLFPLLIFYTAINVWQQLPVKDNKGLGWLKFIGLLLTFGGGCSLAQLNFFSPQTLLPHNSGGLLGWFISLYLVKNVGNFGATLLMLACFLAGITLHTGLSWFGLIDKIQLYSRHLWQQIRQKINNWSKAAPTNPVWVEKVEPQFVASESITQPIVENEPVVGVAHNWQLPSLSLLLKETGLSNANSLSTAKLQQLALEVEQKLKEFAVIVKVVGIEPGPIITRLSLELAPGMKVSRISALAKDLARALSVSRVRVVEVIAGKNYVGLEVPNPEREIVRLQEIIASKSYQEASSPLTLALGKDIAGAAKIANLASMPHLLVAGTTGAGKSVAINAMLLSLLYKASPEEVKLILIDPKMLELAVYADIPHLLTPVVTDMKDAALALQWCVKEMERRYALMAQAGVRNISGYNTKVTSDLSAAALPYIVVIIDEFADMMMTVGKKVEELIARLAQKARASGIHMLLATQRPSVDVITGLIKANIPTRIAFQVSSKIDSRTILDQMGAEQLLGNGDMLYLPAGVGIPERVHGAFVSDEEVHKVVKFLTQSAKPNYVADILQVPQEQPEEVVEDALYQQALAIIKESKRASISYLQRRLKIGYNKAASLMESLESAGIVSAPQPGSGLREVLR